jgi:purine-binding chemotaxis protein CheW
MKQMIDIKSYLSYRIGNEYYAANVKYVHNIIEYTDITKVPKMPDYMLGIINLRGMALPVVDSRIKFGLSATEITGSTCILVMEIEVDKKPVFVGFLVDAVAEVLEIEEEEIKDMPSMGSLVNTDFLSGVYHDEEKFVMIMDVNRLFADREIRDMKKLTKEMSS